MEGSGSWVANRSASLDDAQHHEGGRAGVACDVAHARGENRVAEGEGDRVVDEGTILNRTVAPDEAEEAVGRHRACVVRVPPAPLAEAILEATAQVVHRVGDDLTPVETRRE